MKQRKTPLRKCVITNERLPKNELLRVVRNQENVAQVDLTGKVNGRGAYIKKDIKVLELAKKTKKLERHLEISVDEKIYQEIEQIINDEK